MRSNKKVEENKSALELNFLSKTDWADPDFEVENLTKPYWTCKAVKILRGKWEGTRGGHVSKYDSIEAANAVNDDNWRANVIINVRGANIISGN